MFLWGASLFEDKVYSCNLFPEKKCQVTVIWLSVVQIQLPSQQWSAVNHSPWGFEDWGYVNIWRTPHECRSIESNGYVKWNDQLVCGTAGVQTSIAPVADSHWVRGLVSCSDGCFTLHTSFYFTTWQNYDRQLITGYCLRLPAASPEPV